MKLTPKNFFTQLIFHPLKADTKKAKVMALATSILCGVFSLGICHLVCGLRNSITFRSSKNATEQDQKIFNLRNFCGISRNEKKMAPIEVIFSPEIKAILDPLFENSAYSLDTLPTYPTITPNTRPERNKMKAPIMKGKTEDGRLFIAFKLECTLQKKDLEKLPVEYQNRKNFHVDDVLVIYQYDIDHPLMWDQANRGRALKADFFSANFTDPYDGTILDSQKMHFESLKTLLQKGQSVDTNTLTWSLSKK